MTQEEKAAAYDAIAAALWDMARHGNLLQSTLASALIRQFKIQSPEGDDPESA